MIQKHPCFQYFCGYKAYDDSKLPFDPSLMVYLRKYLTPEILGEMSEMILAAQNADADAHKDYLAPIRTQTAPAMRATCGTPATLKHLGAMPKTEGTKDAKKKSKG